MKDGRKVGSGGGNEDEALGEVEKEEEERVEIMMVLMTKMNN